MATAKKTGKAPPTKTGKPPVKAPPKAAAKPAAKTVAQVKPTAAKAKPKKAKESERIQLWTPAGRFSYPSLLKPDNRPEYGDGAFKVDLLISKEDWKAKGGALKEAVMKAGLAKWEDFDLKGAYRIPFKDTDKDDKIDDERQKGCILIRAKSGKRKDGPATQPYVMGPQRDPETGKYERLTDEEIGRIKGGDWGKLLVTVFPYDQSGGGVTLALTAVHFWKAGEAFGQGITKAVESAEEFDVDEPEDDDDTAEGEDDVSEDDFADAEGDDDDTF